MHGLKLYNEFVAHTPNNIVRHVVEDIPCGRGWALDLGAGSLRDSRFLKEAGFEHVVAVDSSEESLPYASEDIELIIKPIEDYVPERNTYDLAICVNTLFFLPRVEIKQLMETLYESLHRGGLLVFNVLGNLDPWAESSHKTPFTRVQAQALTTRYELVLFDEFSAVSPTSNGGEKAWHLWVMVLRKP